MPVYNIEMDQGLVLNVMAGNWITTGSTSLASQIQSCSAIVMVNPATGVGGMYHMPAGPLNGNKRLIIRLMRAAVMPTEYWLFYGNAQMVGTGNAGSYDMINFLHNYTTHVNVRKATGGIVNVSVLGANSDIRTGAPPLPITHDLSATVPGVQPFGTLYG